MNFHKHMCSFLAIQYYSSVKLGTLERLRKRTIKIDVAVAKISWLVHKLNT